LEDTVERIYHGSAFGQTHHGVFIIRGENVVLIGQVVSLFRCNQLIRFITLV
jgi:U6 snRNA-associated Sm-like protein LSm1